MNLFKRYVDKTRIFNSLYVQTRSNRLRAYAHDVNARFRAMVRWQRS